MKKFFFILLLLTNICLFSQTFEKIEIIGGMNINKFYDLVPHDKSYSSSYTYEPGYIFGLVLDYTEGNWLAPRIGINYCQYSGKINASDGGTNGGRTLNAYIDKKIISLSLLPVNFQIKNNFDLNLGFELSTLIYEAFSGTSTGWGTGVPYWNFELEDRYFYYNSIFNIGFRSRIAYNINLSDKLIISPQYSYYLGLNHELTWFPFSKSMKHYLCLGIGYKI